MITLQVGRLEHVEGELAQTQATLEGECQMSLNKEVLGQQLQDQRMLNASIATSRGILDR